MGRESRDVLAEKAHGARRRRKVAGHAIEQRRLAGAVRSEHGAPLARPHRQRDSVSAASAPNSGVTPRNSRALPVPTADSRWATYPCAAPCRWPRRRPATGAPAPPEADDAVGREEARSPGSRARSEAEPVAVEPDRDSKSSAKVRRITKINAPMNAPIGAPRPRPPRSSGYRWRPRRRRARRDCPFSPDEQHAAESRRRKPRRRRRRSMGVDVEAERGHPARIVAHALQGEAEGRAREVDDGRVGQRGHAQER